MTDHHIRIRIQLHQPAGDSDATTPAQAGSRPARRSHDARSFRKGGKGLVMALCGIVVGLTIAYLALPTNDFTSSGSGTSDVDLAAISEKSLRPSDAGLDGAREETAPSPGTLSISEGPISGGLAAGLLSPDPTGTVSEIAREGSTGAPPAPADVRHDPDSTLTEAAQDTANFAPPSPTTEQDSSGKVQASLSSLQPLRAPSSADKRVARSQLTSGMRGREPVDRLGSSVTLAGRKGRTVFYFTDLRGLEGQTVLHRWERNGKVAASIPFTIDGKRWRVYSRNTLTLREKGNWRVVVADAKGNVLASQSFTVAQR